MANDGGKTARPATLRPYRPPAVISVPASAAEQLTESIRQARLANELRQPMSSKVAQ
jgi:hypothetical protein